MHVTVHAIRNWQDRVDSDASWEQAERDIIEMARRGSRSRKARRWVVSRATGSAVFVYDHRRPKVALIVSGQTVITVLTADSAGQGRREFVRQMDRISRGART